MAVKNSTILDAIWLEATDDYQQRVPQATQSGVDTVRDTLFANGNRKLLNEFHTALFDRIGQTYVNKWTWANPLAAFKRPNMVYGAHIQELAVDLIKAAGYNFEDNNVFKRNPAKVHQEIHTVNRQDKYLITINLVELRKAFTSETGLNDLISRELEIPRLSDEYDEFNIFKALMARAYANGELYKVATPFADEDAPTSAELKFLSKSVRTAAGRFAFPSGRYNARGVPTVSRREDLVLIVTPEIQAALDVDVLADAFHIDRTDFAQNLVVIDEFPMAGVYAMLVDRGWFVCADTVKETESFANAASLELNYWFHHWGVYSTSPFMNAVVFGSVEGTETGVVSFVLDSITADVVDENGASQTTYNYGDDLTLRVTGAGTTTPDNPEVVAPAGYRVEITLAGPADEDGDREVIEKTINTSISRTGTLRVQEGLEAGSTVTYTVTSTYVDPSGDGDAPATPKTSTKVLTVA